MERRSVPDMLMDCKSRVRATGVEMKWMYSETNARSITVEGR